VRARTQFFVEWMALDLVRDASGAVLGVTALEMETGEVMVLHARATLFATGGRADLLLHDQRVHLHRRRPRHGGARAASLSKTWSSGSFTRRASRAQAC